MASALHSATVRMERHQQDFSTVIDCSICHKQDPGRTKDGTLTTSDGRKFVVYVKSSELIKRSDLNNPFVHLTCDPLKSYHYDCVVKWFSETSQCPTHKCDVTLESRSIEQVSSSSELPKLENMDDDDLYVKNSDDELYA